MHHLRRFRRTKLVALIIIIIAMIITIDRLELRQPVLWLMIILPKITIMNLYPRWKTTLLTVSLSSVLIYPYAFSNCFNHGGIEYLTRCLLIVTVGELIYVFVSYYMIKSHKLANKLAKLSMTDSLTQTINFRGFKSVLDREIESFDESKPLSLISIDIDKFKEINDTYGHMFGDKVLKGVSKTIKNLVNEDFTVSRIGGEEFSIIMPDTKLQDAIKIGETLRKKTSAIKFLYKDKVVRVTISLGVGQYNNESSEEFRRRVDKLLYESKENGRNRLTY